MALTDKQKTGLLITVFVGTVGLIVIAWVHFMIGRGMINTYNRRAKEAKEEITDLNKQLAAITELMKQKDEIEKQAEMIRKVTQRLPSSPDAPGFLNALVMSLSTSGIIQEEVKPEKTSPMALYTEIPYRVKAHGYYHGFGQFLTLIEQNPNRFMRVKSLTLANNVDRPSMHPIEMEIATFMFNKE